MTILPITGAADDVSRVTDAAVDGFIVWTTADDDPVLMSVRATKRPAVIHSGPEPGGRSAREHRPSLRGSRDRRHSPLPTPDDRPS